MYTCNSCIVMQVSTQIVYKNYIGMLLSNPYIVTKGLVLYIIRITCKTRNIHFAYNGNT